MKSNSKALIGLAALAVCIGGIVIYNTRPQEKPEVAQAESNAEKPEEAPGKVKLAPGRAMIGGIERPASDVRFAKDREQVERKPPRKRQGYSPSVDPESNEQTQLVAEALKSREKPERFSSFVVKRGFDAEKFRAEPAKYAAEYASVVEPGRVFAPAQPGDGVSVLRAESSRFHRVKQGEALRLSVEAVPNAPVTFASQDLGQFENQLSSVTVVANEQGIASATYTASGGTIDEVQILAASPVTTGQVAFTVSVKVDGDF